MRQSIIPTVILALCSLGHATFNIKQDLALGVQNNIEWDTNEFEGSFDLYLAPPEAEDITGAIQIATSVPNTGSYSYTPDKSYGEKPACLIAVGNKKKKVHKSKTFLLIIIGNLGKGGHGKDSYNPGWPKPGDQYQTTVQPIHTAPPAYVPPPVYTAPPVAPPVYAPPPVHTAPPMPPPVYAPPPVHTQPPIQPPPSYVQPPPVFITTTKEMETPIAPPPPPPPTAPIYETTPPVVVVPMPTAPSAIPPPPANGTFVPPTATIGPPGEQFTGAATRHSGMKSYGVAAGGLMGVFVFGLI